MCAARSHVRFAPKSDPDCVLLLCAKSGLRSFKNLVRGDQEALRDGDAERLGRLDVDEDFKLGGSLYWQVTGFLASQDAASIDAVGIGDAATIAQQSTGCSKLAAVKDCRDLVANGDCGKVCGLTKEE
jgi:hypothetical protein